MPHSGKFHQDRGYIPRENPNYFDKRSRPPNSSGGRLSQGTTEHSRSSSAFADPEPNHLGPRQGYDNPPPPYYHSKKTFSEKCSNLCSRRASAKLAEAPSPKHQPEDDESDFVETLPGQSQSYTG